MRKALVDGTGGAIDHEEQFRAGESVGWRRRAFVKGELRTERLQKRVWTDPEAQAKDLLLDRILPPEERRRQVRDLGGRVVDGPMDRTNLGKPLQRLDEIALLELLPRPSHELDKHLARVAPFAKHEVT